MKIYKIFNFQNPIFYPRKTTDKYITIETFDAGKLQLKIVTNLKTNFIIPCIGFVRYPSNRYPQ